MHDFLVRLHFSEAGIQLIFNILGALAILVIGMWLAARLANVAMRAMQRANIDSTLSGFLRNAINGVLIVLLVVMALQQLGVPSAPLIAALSTAGLAIGLALQGSLSNLAWGVLLIVFRPFKVGDFITAAGVDGTVEGINLMHTLLVLPDNREAIVPNGKIGADAIVNFNRRGVRRFEVKLGIAYKDDVGKAMATVQALFAADARILRTPAPGIWTESLGVGAVNLVIRAYTKIDDLWPAQTDLLRAIKERFEADGISIPVPQRELTVVQGAPLVPPQA
ncbi:MULTISPECIES: mechanosensitive ion channel family protein [Dyella]|uniref:Small-conductance mechanosensitive channel n=2 Tax=Dyella TaxID=231454 RepID=A0A4R0YKZ7_9GAMM|nr:MULTISPECIES: mechanosensitive ion channel domain-containing protein [Dyella]TBR36801.1 mechanosensitive ion channel [Dyella terrae]TCI08108.1 mechanosensitive ion channel [Dyella soli]